MEKAKKRERSINFTNAETKKLVSLIESKKHIIENRKSDAVTWKEKVKAWKAIETDFNSTIDGVFRDAKHLKIKYEALKRDTRKKFKLKAGEAIITTTPLTPVEQKIKDMILLSMEDGQKIYDSVEFNGASDQSCSMIFDETLIGTDKPFSDNYASPDTYKEKRSFEKYAEAKLEIIVLQNRLIQEEFEERRLKLQLLIEEMEHKKDLYELEKKGMELKRELYELEKKEMLLKIDILKTELENTNK